MRLDLDFLQVLVDNNAKDDLKIFITDDSATLLASTQLINLDKYLNLATYVIDNNKPIVVEDVDNELSSKSVIAIPFYQGKILNGTIIIEGEKESAKEVGNKLCNSIESLLLYNIYSSSANNSPDYIQDQYNELTQLLLDDNFQEDRILALMNNLEIDNSLMYSVIYINYSFEKANYFNINLNLGYKSEIVNTRDNIDRSLRSIKYLTKQDIISRKGQNGSVIIKSYFPSSDIDEVYLANQKICEEVKSKLENIEQLNFHIASGDVYKNLKDVKKSFQEAKDILDIAKHYNKEERIFSLKSILLEDTFHYLDTHIINRLIITNINKLKKQTDHFESLLALVEIYVDCNLNIAKTSEVANVHRNTIKNNLDKFKSITGLDPTNSFSDAFLVKIMAIYNEQNKNK